MYQGFLLRSRCVHVTQSARNQAIAPNDLPLIDIKNHLSANMYEFNFPSARARLAMLPPNLMSGKRSRSRIMLLTK